MSSFFVTRPQVFTYCIILFELICLEKYIKDGKTDFYINGLAVHGSLDSSTNIQQFTIIKIDEDKYNYSIDKSLNPVKLEY